MNDERTTTVVQNYFSTLAGSQPAEPIARVLLARVSVPK